MQLSTRKINFKFTKKKKVIVAIGLLAMVAITFSTLRTGAPVKGSWKPIGKILHIGFTEKLINEHIKLNSQLSIDAILATAEAQELPVEDWVAVRFNKPEVCNLAGCLNLIVDRREETQIAILSLYNSDDRNQFTPGKRKDCLTAIQTMKTEVLSRSFCKH